MSLLRSGRAKSSVTAVATAFAAVLVAFGGAAAQNPPVSQAQAEQILQQAQSNPGLADQIRQRIQASGMTPDQIRARLAASGYAAVTATTISGRSVLRLCTINPRTTHEDLRETLERLAT